MAIVLSMAGIGVAVTGVGSLDSTALDAQTGALPAGGAVTLAPVSPGAPAGPAFRGGRLGLGEGDGGLTIIGFAGIPVLLIGSAVVGGRALLRRA